MPNQRQPPPDAAEALTNADAEPNLDDLVIGAPFAIAHDCELVEHGCTVTIRCGCGQAFRWDLLAAGFKGCPQCKRSYTHVLLVCLEDNDEMAGDALEVIFNNNGVQLPDGDGAGDDDAGDDEHAAEVVDGDAGDDE